MPVYRVLIHGTGFLREIDGVIGAVGFYVTRFVNSVNEADACAAAMSLVRAHLDAGALFTAKSRIVVESFEETLESKPSVQPGFAWFYEQ